MSSTTVGNVRARTMNELRTQGGLSTQIYADDVILTNIQSCFDSLFDMPDVWWPDYTFWTEMTVDGTTGQVTENLSDVLYDHTHIRAMYYDGNDRTVARLPSNIRPNSVSGQAAYWQPLAQDTKIFRLLPIDTPTATLEVHHKKRPAKFLEETDVIYFSEELLALGAAYYFLAGEGAERDPTNAMLARYMDQRKLIVDNVVDARVPLSRRTGSLYPTDWYWGGH